MKNTLRPKEPLGLLLAGLACDTLSVLLIAFFLPALLDIGSWPLTGLCLAAGGLFVMHWMLLCVWLIRELFARFTNRFVL